MENKSFLSASDIELVFALVYEKVGHDINAIFQKLINSGLDSRSLGFWVWDIANNKELYSPQFRAVLGFQNDIDFPDVPESWMQQINKEDLKLVMNNFNAHVKTGGLAPYSQLVRYNKKDNTEFILVCHGKVISWLDKDKGLPSIMVGIHTTHID